MKKALIPAILLMFLLVPVVAKADVAIRQVATKLDINWIFVFLIVTLSEVITFYVVLLKKEKALLPKMIAILSIANIITTTLGYLFIKEPAPLCNLIYLIIVGFVLSTIVEYLIIQIYFVKAVFSKKSIFKTVVLANLFSYIILAIFLFLVAEGGVYFFSKGDICGISNIIN